MQMRYLKILGLAAIVAAAVMALAGAGTAGATVFCPTTSTPCNGVPYEVGTSVDAKIAKNAKFETTTGEVWVECAEGTLKGKIAHQGSESETVLGTIEELTWAKCSRKTATVANGFYEVHSIAGTDNGTVTGGNSEVTVEAFPGVTCTYSVEREDLGTLKGGLAPTLEIATTVTKTAGSFLCPKLAKWTAEYKWNEPLPLYVEVK
jgi:hypothetical protein